MIRDAGAPAPDDVNASNRDFSPTGDSRRFTLPAFSGEWDTSSKIRRLVMRTALVSIVLLVLSASGVGLSVCPQATSQVIEHKLGFTIHAVRMPSAHGLVKATAAIPDSSAPSHATVFSFSTLVGSEPQESVDMTPLAIELTQQGWSTLVIER